MRRVLILALGILSIVGCGVIDNSLDNEGKFSPKWEGTLGTIQEPENTDYGGTTGPGVIYTFVGWDASPTPGNYPDQMSIRCTDMLDPTLTATVSGNYTGHTNNSETGFGARGHGLGGISVLNTGTQNNICNYNSSSGTFDLNSGDSVNSFTTGFPSTTIQSVDSPTQITLNANATATTSNVPFFANGKAKWGDMTNGSAIITNVRSAGFISAIDIGPFNTTGVTGLRVFFEAAQISNQPREYGLRLQYSTDGGVNFTDVPGPVEFKSDAVGASTAYHHFGPVAISAIDNQANVILRWRYYSISGSGNRTRIALRNIRVSNDATLPSAPTGLTATALSHNTIRLNWTHATDNITTANYMRYDIYQATSSGGQNFSNPPQYTVRGTNTATISGLNSSTTYYFVVRARDEQG
ncbi:MAG: fibronectin type III domain-containing protein, partial [Leptospiraceae bacterium]|nr:fibronectin type III domain-containing protein [Leptospiraceae bacterium]